MEIVAETRRKRLEILIKEFGTQRALADALERSPSQLSQWKNASRYSSNKERGRAMEDDTARLIEEKTGKPTGWMDQPLSLDVTTHAAQEYAAKHTATTDFSNVSGMTTATPYPVISWVQAGSWSEVAGELSPADVTEWYLYTGARPPKRAFALIVEGDSMTSASGDSFPAGTRALFNPEISPRPNDFVVAMRKGDEATFKRLVTRVEGGREVSVLRPLNEKFGEILLQPETDVILGVLIDAQMPLFRRK